MKLDEYIKHTAAIYAKAGLLHLLFKL